MKETQLFEDLKVGKFLVHDSLLIFEDPITGVLRSFHLETEKKTLFDGHCTKEIKLPFIVWGLCFGSNNTLLHCWGGNLRIYSLHFLSRKQEVTKYNKAYLSKARATLIPDDPHVEEDKQLFCEHMGTFYCLDHSTLYRVTQNGNYENVNLNMNIVCMYSCNKHFFVCDDQGLLYTLDTTSLDSSLQSLKFSCLSKAFFDHPRQILHFQSFFYVLDSRGLWILGSTLTFINIPHVLHFAVRKSSDTQNIELVCREFNSLFCIS